MSPMSRKARYPSHSSSPPRYRQSSAKFPRSAAPATVRGRITPSGGSGCSLVFVVVLPYEQLAGKASGNEPRVRRRMEKDVHRRQTDNPVTHILPRGAARRDAEGVDGVEKLEGGRNVQRSSFQRKGNTKWPDRRRGWPSTNASSNEWSGAAPSRPSFSPSTLVPRPPTPSGRHRVQPHSVNPVTFARTVSCEGRDQGGHNRYRSR